MEKIVLRTKLRPDGTSLLVTFDDDTAQLRVYSLSQPLVFEDHSELDCLLSEDEIEDVRMNSFEIVFAQVYGEDSQ